MAELLIKILPLQLASTLSPGILALTIVLFARKTYALSRVLAFLLGSLLVVLFISMLGLKAGQSIDTFDPHSQITVIIDFALAGLFLYFGIRGLIGQDKERKVSVEENPTRQLGKWFLLGLIISITNFDAVLLNFAAAKEIGASDVNTGNKIILFTTGIIFFVLPILLPMIFYFGLPKLAQKILQPINTFLVKYGRYLVSAIFIIFGIYLIYKGIK